MLLQKKLEKHLQTMKSGLLILPDAISITRRRLFVDDVRTQRQMERQIDEIRPLTAVSPDSRVHGSTMFTRGQTQICDICALAPLSEA